MDWWYVRAYPGHPDLMDEATRVLVPWVAGLAAEERAPKWFFTRYWDMTGHHLRLRVQCSGDGADRAHERLPELVALLGSFGRPTATERLVPGSLPQGLPAVRRARCCLYAPELAKYGGRKGVSLAEELFTAASSWYAENDVAALDPLRDRAALAVAYMGSLVRTALPEGLRPEFWAAHRRQWGRHLRMAVPGQDELRALITRRAAAAATAAGLHERLRRSVDEHVDQVVRTLDRAAAAGVPVERAVLLLHYLHMDLNRWGFVPAEESLLGIVAAHG
ncbi:MULTISPECIES: thiopeptide-type bacteriocin biosynthesis protein [Streptomyces]|uniref:thiopeptide-type bacteriocin biosynthesis protein n=1 Tax=Streptomyces TaxID=1883 RepID=UPI0004BF42F0|nr:MULTISPECIES: thiopeptide-type bacteriocin biosynthesis protein [Streptomyces]